MCTIIDLETRQRRDTDHPTLSEFLIAQFGRHFYVAAEWDPNYDGDGDFVFAQDFSAALDEYKASYGTGAEVAP